MILGSDLGEKSYKHWVLYGLRLLTKSSCSFWKPIRRA